MRIDTKLSDPLRNLPAPGVQDEPNLALRNLIRAGMVRLATGQRVVERVEHTHHERRAGRQR